MFHIVTWRFNEWKLTDFWVTCNVKALLANLCSRSQATIDKQRQTEERSTQSKQILTPRSVHRDNVGAM